MEQVKQSNFERLAAINVNEQVEKKGGLSYLSWAWALDHLLRLDPEAEWDYADIQYFPDRTAMVRCTVKAFGKKRTAPLPIMDHRNKPIAEPDSFQVNTAMQRALVKAIALHGLGLYIYAGEDLPPGEEPKDTEEPPRPNTATQVAKDAFSELSEETQKKMQAMAIAIKDLCDNKEPMVPYVSSHIPADDQESRLALWSLLPSYVRTAFKKEQALIALARTRPQFTPAELGGQA